MTRNIKLLLAASICVHSGVNMIAPLYAVYIKGIGGTLLDAGLAVGVYGIGKSLFYFLLGRIKENQLSKKKMIFAGYFIHALGYFLYLFADRHASCNGYPGTTGLWGSGNESVLECGNCDLIEDRRGEKNIR